MLSAREESERRLATRGWRKQVLYSVPHYLKEISTIRSINDLYRWTYFKFPYFFPLPDFPFYLSVEVTNACNYSCKHCFRTAKPRPVGFMDISLFEKIVCEASRHKPVHRAFKILGSGEAALHPHFRELMQIASHHGVPTMAYTNGYLLKSFTPQEILSWGLDWIVVTVDGVDAESHERSQIGSCYAALRKAVTDFYSTRNSHGYRTPIIEVRHLLAPGETPAQLIKFRRSWLEVVDTVKYQYTHPATGLWDFDNPERRKCRAIRREMGIWWDGTMPLCFGYWRDSLGNVRDVSISELWRHPKLESMRRCHDRREFAAVPVCLRCRNTI